MLEHFEMYITITDILGQKRIDLPYPIQGKEVIIVSMFSDIVQYYLRKPVKVLLIMNKKKQMLEGIFMDRVLNVSIERKLITTLHMPMITSLRWTSWHVSQRSFSAWMSLTTLTTWRWKTQQSPN